MSKKVDKINKVEEPITYYEKEGKIVNDITAHPLFAKVIEKCKQDIKEGNGIPHEEVMKRFKERFPFLK